MRIKTYVQFFLLLTLAGYIITADLYAGCRRGGFFSNPCTITLPQSSCVWSYANPSNCYTVPGCDGGSCPIVPQGYIGAVSVQTQLMGVDRTKGVGKADAFRVADSLPERENTKIGQLPLKDDAGLPYVVVVGTDSDRRAADVAVKSSSLKDAAHFVTYKTEDWQAKDVGYAPGVWVVGPRQADGTGEVLAYASSVEEFAGSVEKMAEALRKPGPIIDKAKLPSLKSIFDPSQMISDGVGKIVGQLLVMASFAVAGLALFIGKGA